MANGGAIQHDSATATSTITNSTFVGSQADDNGAVRMVDGTMTVTNATVTGNTGGSGAGIGHDGGTLTLASSIVAGNIGPNCSASPTIVDGGSNLAFPAADECPGATVADPLLDSLAANGGPTLTQLPLDDSPAIDGVAGACPPPATDQRGLPRAVAPACDIGAVERDERPDGQIRKKGASGLGAYEGGGIYNNDATDQSKRLKEKKGDEAIFKVLVDNDAVQTTDAITVTGEDGTNKFKVRYFDGDTEVTDEVVGAGYGLASLAPGASHELTIKVKVKGAANKGDEHGVLVTATSGELPAHVDAVLATTERK